MIKRSKRDDLEKRKEWQSHINKWSISGLTQSEYCRRNNLKNHRFTYWKTKFEREKKAVNFVQVPSEILIQKSTAKSVSIQLKIGSQFGLEIPDGFSQITLEKILQALRKF